MGVILGQTPLHNKKRAAEVCTAAVTYMNTQKSHVDWRRDIHAPAADFDVRFYYFFKLFCDKQCVFS